MPAAAVIPAPIAYIKVVAVKKLVVEVRGRLVRVHRKVRTRAPVVTFRLRPVPFSGCRIVTGTFTLSKLECSRQAKA